MNAVEDGPHILAARPAVAGQSVKSIAGLGCVRALNSEVSSVNITALKVSMAGPAGYQYGVHPILGAGNVKLQV
jgi:hypothetical protein